MKKKFGTSNSIFKIQSAEIQIVQKVGQRSSTGKSRWSPKSRFSSLRLVLSWPWHINSWEPRDALLREPYIYIYICLWREQHPFLVATSLMRKQTCVTIATWDYQRWIKYFSPSHSLVNPLTDRVFLFNICILLS